MAGNSSQQTGSQTTTSYIPFLNQLTGVGQTIFNSPTAWAPDTRSYVTPFASQTTQGLNQLQNIANMASGGGGMVPPQGGGGAGPGGRLTGPGLVGGANIANGVQGGSHPGPMVGPQRPGSTPGPMIPPQTNGGAGGGGAFQQNWNNIAALINGNGLNSPQTGALAGLERIANLPTGQGTSALNDIQRQNLSGYQGLARQPVQYGTNALNDIQRQGLGYTQKIAGGGEMSGDPYFEDVLKRSNADIQGAANLNAAQAGRYGSGIATDVLARNIADNSSNLRYQNFGDQQARRDQAIAQLQGIGGQADTQSQEQLNRQLAGMSGVNALGNQADAQYQNALGRRTGALNDIFNIGQTQRNNVLGGSDALTGAYQAMQAPANTLLGIGQQYQNLYSNQLQDQSRLFNQQQEAQRAPLDWLSRLVTGSPSQTTTTSVPGQSPWATGFGGALTGYGLGGWPGALIGGLGGALF